MTQGTAGPCQPRWYLRLDVVFTLLPLNMEIHMMDTVAFLNKTAARLPAGLCSESHVVAEIYHLLRCAHPDLEPQDICLEHPNPSPDGRAKCDIVVLSRDLWIEVKAYIARQKGETWRRKHTAVQSSPRTAAKRLGKLKEKTTVLVVYRDGDYSPKPPNDWGSLPPLCKQNGVELIPWPSEWNLLRSR